MKQKLYTTVNISHSYQKMLKKMALGVGTSQVEYLEKCLFWFKQTGLDPTNIEPFSPKVAIEKLTKRVDSSIAFFQNHEKQKLKPLLDEIMIANQKLTRNIEHSITSENLSGIKSTIAKLQSEIDNSNASLDNLIDVQKKIIAHLIKKNEKDNKNNIKTQRMIVLLFEALTTKSITGGIKQNIITEFSNL